MQFTPYINFNGNCEEAFEFYERIFGGKIAMLVPYSTTPMADQVPPDWSTKMCHATLMLGDSAIMGSDAMPDRYEAPKGISITFVPKDAAEAERIFSALAEKGTVLMALQETFWAKKFGMLVDRFNVSWMINYGDM